MSISAFENFYTEWLEEMKHRFKRLRAALQQTSFVEEEGIFNLVQSCHSHYHMYMSEKIRLCKEDLSFVIAGMWRSPFEASFLWIGGWRPTTAIVLAYSLMGTQIEGELQKLLQGIELPSMAALSAKQLSMIDALQQKLRESEDSLSNRLAILQMLFADQQMAKAAAANPPPSESNDFSDFREAMEPKLASLRDIFAEAEQLRGETIQEMLRILRPIQAGQYALAAYEMTMAVQKLGDKREGRAQLQALVHVSRSNIRELASQGNVDLLTKALQSGLDPSETDYDGRTPLDSGTELCKAAAIGNNAYLSRLAKYGVDPNVSDYGKPTPLHAAAAGGNTEAAQVLVKEGADVLAKDRYKCVSV
ncbi:hypothetical protein KP509_01G030100 [Ceratopteris richardii]|uniref:DOG1 domain-containing protein n=1 Tax=Ceratopteris richardii TaxID=49495 RepID=A0A8T2VBV3_CERRI|nr:hypothetical protein KP509_01G030100 [Ceratopteris richardii]